MRHRPALPRRLITAAAIGCFLLVGCDRDPGTPGSTSPGPASAGAARRPATAKSARSGPRPQKAPVADADVEKEVIRIVAEQMGVKAAEVRRGTSLKRDLKADELDAVELVMELEDAFEISIPDDVAEKFVTVGDMVDHVRTARKTPG